MQEIFRGDASDHTNKDRISEADGRNTEAEAESSDGARSASYGQETEKNVCDMQEIFRDDAQERTISEANGRHIEAEA